MSEELDFEGSVDVRRLVDVLRPVRAEALKVWFQEIRLQYLVAKPLQAQLLFDRKHKYQPRLSKPLGYYRFTQAADLLTLAADVIAASCTLALQSKVGVYSSFDVKNAVDSFWNMMREDICELVDKSLQNIAMKQMEIAKRQLGAT